MKTKIKYFFISFILSGLCFCVMVFGVYLNIVRATEGVGNNASSVPYNPIPENKGILLNIGGSKTYFYLDFEASEIKLIYANGLSMGEIEAWGYEVDFLIKGDYSFISEIVDAVGGIDLETDGEVFSLTGNQVCELLSYSEDYQTLRRQVVEGVIKRISQIGFGKEELLLIIENSDTELSLLDCFLWEDYLKEMCGNSVVVN